MVQAGQTALRWSSERELCLWKNVRDGRCARSRDELMTHYLPYARVVAATCYSRRLHDEIEFAEYHQLAVVGMIEALDRYDPDGGAQFKTFASRRMHGSILDGLESLTEKQRQIAARKRIRRERLESLVTGGAEDAAIPVPANPFGSLMEVAFGLALGYMLEGTGMIGGERSQVIPTSPQHESLERRQTASRLRELLARLPVPDQAVLRGHYLQQLPFDEIGRTLGVTKGRISQIHKQALRRMRSLLRDAERPRDVAL